MIAVAVCDDSNLILESMKKNLEEYAESKNEKIKICLYNSGEELLNNYTAQYDILFLDIKMPGMNGIEAAQKIRIIDKKVIIIFLTSLIEYAIEGYSVNAANYIIKPMGKHRLFMEMNRWMEKLKETQEPFITFHNDKGKYKVILKDIRFIETYNRNLLIHTKDEEYICYWKLREMEKRIGKYGFARNHASYLVNLCYVDNVEKMEIKVNGGIKIPLSKAKRKGFMEQLAEYWGNHI